MNTAGGNAGTIRLRADPASLIHICHLLRFISALDVPGRLQPLVGMGPALADIADRLRAHDDTAIDAVEALFDSQAGLEALDRWRDLHGFLRDRPAQRLLAEPNGTLDRARRVTGLSDRGAVEAVLDHLARFGLRSTEAMTAPPGESSGGVTTLLTLLDALRDPVIAAITEATTPWSLAATVANRTRQQILRTLLNAGTELTVRQLVERTGVAWMSGHVQILDKAGVIDTRVDGAYTFCRLHPNERVLKPIQEILAVEDDVSLDTDEPWYALRALAERPAQLVARALAGTGEAGLTERQCLDAMDARSDSENASGRSILAAFEGTLLAVVDRPGARMSTWRYHLSPVGRQFLDGLAALEGLTAQLLSNTAIVRSVCADLLVPERIIVALYVAGRPDASASARDIVQATGVDPRLLHHIRVLCSSTSGSLNEAAAIHLRAHPSTTAPLVSLLASVAMDACPEDGELRAVIARLATGRTTYRDAQFVRKRLAGSFGRSWTRVFHPLTRSDDLIDRFVSIVNAPLRSVAADPSLQPLTEAGLLDVLGGEAFLSRFGEALGEGIRALINPIALTNSSESTTGVRLERVVDALNNDVNQDILTLAGDQTVAVDSLVDVLSLPEGRARYHLDILRDAGLLVDSGIRNRVTDRQAYRIPAAGASVVRQLLQFVAPMGLHIEPSVATAARPVIE